MGTVFTEEDAEKLKGILVPGKKIRLYFGDDNPKNELRHIRAVVDDYVIVHRTWIRRWKAWRYDIETLYYYWLCFRDGYLKPAGRSKTNG